MVLMILIKNYFKWHYSLAFVDIFHIWRDMTLFVFNFFSISTLMRTFFSPWKRLYAQRNTKGFDVFDMVSTHFVNMVMRVVGALMRSVLIVVGLLTIGVVVIGGVIFFIGWMVMPFLIVFLCVAGIHLLLFK